MPQSEVAIAAPPEDSASVPSKPVRKKAAAPSREEESDEEPDSEEDPSAPSEEEMASYLGAMEASGTENGARNDSSGDDALPTLEAASAAVPAKAKALMDELFRARLEKVKRIDPKEIR